MVNIVFLVEGETEEILVSHLAKTRWFDQFSLNVIAIINVRGNGNLCPHNISKYVNQANTLNPDKIIILTDLDCSPCIEETKIRLGTCSECILIVAKKAIESWFLADTPLMQKIMQDDGFYLGSPETTDKMPFDVINDLLKAKGIRGTGPSKPRFAKKMIKEGYDIDSAIAHASSHSIQYFKNKMEALT